MAWDKRGYFYISERCGNQVTRDYFGNGPTAKIVAGRLDAERRRRVAASDAMRTERRRIADLDKNLISLNILADLAAASILETAGFHRHNRGEWRKKRERTDASDAHAGCENNR